MKKICFYMDEKTYEPNIKHGYYETLNAINNNEEEIHTTQLCLLSTSLLTNDYMIFISRRDETFAINLGKNSCTNRRIKVGHNLLKLLLNDEFKVPRDDYYNHC